MTSKARKKGTFIGILFLLVIVASVVIAMISQNYRIGHKKLDSSGGTSSSSNYKSRSSIGQITSGKSGSTIHEAYSGYVRLSEEPAGEPTPAVGIQGKVTESDGVTAISGAKIEAKQGDNMKGNAVTNINGCYTISGLELGNYDVVASKAGHESGIRTGISLTESKPTAEVNFKLAVLEKDALIPYDNLFDPNSGEYATIKYNVVRDGNVDMKILDSRGREIKTLLTGHKSSGSYVITWNGKDDNGKKVGSGIYLIHLKTNRGSIIKKIAVVK